MRGQFSDRVDRYRLGCSRSAAKPSAHLRYDVCAMAEVSARDLRNHTREVLERVERGESIEITVDRRPVAELRPPRRKPSFIPTQEMLDLIREHGADPGLLDDIAFIREQRVDFPDE